MTGGLGPRPFCVFCLPRSRSAWMAHYLSYGRANVGHDIILECSAVADWLERFQQGMLGTVETGSVEGWRLMRALQPEMKMAVVLRSPERVLSSLEHLGLPRSAMVQQIELRCAMLLQVSRLPGVKTIDFESLDTPEGAKELFEFCLDEPWDSEWWLELNPLNIQVNWERRKAQLVARSDAMSALRAEIAARTCQLEAPSICH